MDKDIATDNDECEYGVEEDEEEEDEQEGEDEDKKEYADEDDGKEAPMIGKEEMVNTLADDVDSKVDHHPIVLSNQGQVMCEHTQWP